MKVMIEKDKRIVSHWKNSQKAEKLINHLSFKIVYFYQNIKF